MNTATTFLLWLSLAISPAASGDTSGPILSQRVDLIELNHFVDSDGREVFRQVLFYDWSPQHKRFIVRAWRLVKTDSLIPKRRWAPPGYQCTWHDDGVLRQVSAPQYRETWTQHDPERLNRLTVAEDDRRPLLQPGKR